MGFFDKVKEGAAAASEKMKEGVDAAKATYAQKKEEAEQRRLQKEEEERQHRLAMEELVSQKTNEILSSIEGFSKNEGFFDTTNTEELLAFTKEFYDKILMPAKSVTASGIEMYPYISDKTLAKFGKICDAYQAGETAILYFKVKGKQEILLTQSALYFTYALEEDKNFFVKGSVPCDRIGKFSVAKQENGYALLCNEYPLLTVAESKSAKEDFISLGNYFTCIENHDFEITDEEVDKLIQEKIGETIYKEIKKYMVYDDELLVYFAWGLDSLSAKDYIVCTNKQIIKMDREMFGATANVKQFYYEDIVSCSTEQNAQSSDLTVALIETAITAATKTCDLVISTAGTGLRINSLYLVEAERIVAIYHYYRKQVKLAASQPQQVVIQQQAAGPDPLEQLEKLSKMKEMGIISQEEFDAKKADLLAKL